MSLDRNKLALIHVARKELGMEEHDYRALLRRVAGVGSARDLDEAGFRAVVVELERLGFRGGRQLVSVLQTARRPGMASAAQIARIYSLWHAWSGGYDDLHLGRWLRQKFNVDHPRMLDAVTAGRVIPALEKLRAYRKRHPLEAPPRDNPDPGPQP